LEITPLTQAPGTASTPSEVPAHGAARSEAQRSSVRHLAALGACLAALALLRVLALAANGTDLFVDEAQYWAWSLEPAFGYFSKPPLIAWIIAGARHACGDGEFCVRLPSLLVHTCTSLVVFVLAARLYSPQAGFWSALAFATLPGISLSSGIISTDVPLLFAWALALLAFAELQATPRMTMALVLGLALGLGLNAKYAMAYFVPSAAIFFILVPERASLLRRPHLWIALLIGAVLITPNLLWNGANGFATIAHTAGNTGWAGKLLHPGKAAEFFVAQFGVFGPILFGTLILIAWRARTSLRSLSVVDRLLLAFSLPLILVITVQAFLSHAYANWAAPAYVAATVLVTATMIREGSWRWVKGSLALNSAIAVMIAVATWQAGNFTLPGAGDPFARTLGSRELAEAVRRAVKDGEAAGTPYAAVLADEREITTALLYYAPEIAPRVRAWRREGRARDHFEMTRPLTAAPGPVLLVTGRAAPNSILDMFASAHPLEPREISAGRFTRRTVHLFALSGYKGS
jgi:4-amino-4-deoxy-L-arabinose transferase-like glycosyltransferase